MMQKILTFALTLWSFVGFSQQSSVRFLAFSNPKMRFNTDINTSKFVQLPIQHNNHLIGNEPQQIDVCFDTAVACNELASVSSTPIVVQKYNEDLPTVSDNFYLQNKRNIYSSVWGFASLNYLYCDLAAFMDYKMHNKYHTGTIDGVKMTPNFIAASAAMMQVSLANVFLPQVIKNEKTLRWVQIASGAFMTLTQSATLFVGKPTSYYAVFSGLEIASTTFITIDALKWKPARKKKMIQ